MSFGTVSRTKRGTNHVPQSIGQVHQGNIKFRVARQRVIENPLVDNIELYQWDANNPQDFRRAPNRSGHVAGIL